MEVVTTLATRWGAGGVTANMEALGPNNILPVPEHI
jgi:hypothetical protein